MISGIILAAGSSHRMGKPKALLTLGEKTFLQAIIDVLHSARIIDVVVVLGAHAEEILPTLGDFKGNVVINEEWEGGQLTSTIAGLNALDLSMGESGGITGVMVCPVDHPLLTQSLLVDLLQGFWISKKKIIIPTYQGMRGHPVIFAREIFDDLRHASPAIGARDVVHRYAGEIQEVPVEERGVVLNIDNPEEYEQLISHHAL